MAAQLPTVPRRLVLTEAPKSTVSAADIAAPLTGLGEGLARIGQGVEDVATPYVEEEARKQVTVGPDGTPQVTTLPHLMGRLGKLFNTTAVNTYENRLDAEVRDAISKKQVEFENQPDKFKAWWEPYKAQLLANAPAAQRPILESKLIRFGTEGGRHIEVQRQNTDDRLRVEGRNIEVARLDDDIALIARQGGTGTEGFRSRIEQRNKLIDQAVADPRNPISKEKAQAFKDASVAKAYGESILSNVETGISESGYEGGRAALNRGIEELMKGVLGGDPNNPDAASHYGIKVRDINKIKTEGEKLLKQNHASMAGERQTLNQQWADKKAKNNETALTEREWDQLQADNDRTGNWRTAQDIRSTRAALAFTAANRNRPLSERLDVARTGQVPQTWTPGSLIPQSWSTGMIKGESGGDPNAQSTNTSAGGILQFIDSTWLTTIKKWRPELAQGRSDAQLLALKKPHAGWSPDQATQLGVEMGQYYGTDNAEILNKANIPVTPATIKAAHFLGPADAVKLYTVPGHTPVTAFVNAQSIDKNRTVFNAHPTAASLIAWVETQKGGGVPTRAGTGTSVPGAPADMRGGGVSGAPGAGGGRSMWDTPEGTRAWRQLRDELRGDLQERFKQFDSAERQLQFPTKDEVAGMRDTAAAVGNDADIKKAGELEAAAAFGEDYKKLSGPEREQLNAQFANAIANGDTDPVKRDMFRKMQKADADIKALYKTDPQLADAKFSGGRAPQTLQWGNHDQVAAEIEERKIRSGAIQAGEGIPQYNLMRPGERESFAKYMQQADAQGVAKTFEALGQQTDEQIKVMLHDDTIKETIKGLMYSTDYQKNKAAMMGVDALYTRLPVETTQQLGVDSIKRLSNWRTVSRFEDPETGQKRLNRLAQEDPAATERRLEIEKKALSDASDVQPQKVVNEFAWAPWTSSIMGPANWAIGLGQSAIGMAPQKPPDTGTATALMVDYSKMYADALVANNGDKAAAHTSAIEILKKGGIWSVSPTNNRQLMRHAPEVVYEAYPGGITDSGHNWINIQLEQDVEKILRQQHPELGDVGRYGPDKAAGPRYTTSLIADKRTEAEAAKYKKTEPAVYPDPDDPQNKKGKILNIPPSYALVVNDMRFAGPNGRVDALVGKRFHPEPNAAREAYLAGGQRPGSTSLEEERLQQDRWRGGLSDAPSMTAPPEPSPGAPTAPVAPAAPPAAAPDAGIGGAVSDAASAVGGAVAAGTEALRGVAAERDRVQLPDVGREVLAEKVRTGLAAVTEPLDIIQHKLQDAAMRRDGTLKPDQGREIVAAAVERGLAAVREPIAELQDSIQQGIQPTRDAVVGAITRGQEALTAMQDELRAMAEAKGKNIEYDGGRAALKANVEKAIDAGQKALKGMADSLNEGAKARGRGAPMGRRSEGASQATEFSGQSRTRVAMDIDETWRRTENIEDRREDINDPFNVDDLIAGREETYKRFATQGRWKEMDELFYAQDQRMLTALDAYAEEGRKLSPKMKRYYEELKKKYPREKT